MGGGRRFVNTKSQIYFLDPDGMNIGWQTGAGPNGERAYLSTQLVVPARYNFNQGYIYRLKLTNIRGRAGATLYPTIEVAPTTPVTDAYLAHNAIPVQFTAEDFDQVIDGGNFVTKVIYLPDPKYQELAVTNAETLVSTRLEPGVDPILEADKRGTILLIVRLGAIDLEMPSGPMAGAVSSAPVSVVRPAVLPPFRRSRPGRRSVKFRRPTCRPALPERLRPPPSPYRLIRDRRRRPQPLPHQSLRPPTRCPWRPSPPLRPRSQARSNRPQHQRQRMASSA